MYTFNFTVYISTSKCIHILNCKIYFSPDLSSIESTIRWDLAGRIKIIVILNRLLVFNTF